MPASVSKDRHFSDRVMTKYVITGESFAVVQLAISNLMDADDCAEATFSLPVRENGKWIADGFVRHPDHARSTALALADYQAARS